MSVLFYYHLLVISNLQTETVHHNIVDSMYHAYGSLVTFELMGKYIGIFSAPSYSLKDSVVILIREPIHEYPWQCTL